MTNALALSTPFADLMVQADTLVKSGFLPKDVKSKEQAVAIMTMGQELGLGMWAAFNGINVIQGKPTLSPQLMLALIRRSGQLELLDIADDGQKCTVTMKRKGDAAPHTESFSVEDAARMKTTEWVNGEKKTIALAQKYNWQSMPVVMRKWRAISACARIVFPDVVIGFYSPEEIDPDVTIDFETGEMDRTSQSAPRPALVAPAPQPEVVEGDDLVTGENGASGASQDEPDAVTQKFIEHDRKRNPATIPGVTHGVDANVADISDLYDKNCRDLVGSDTYRVREYSVANSNTNAEKHWRNRFAHYFQRQVITQLDMTVREFVEKMATPHGAETNAA